MQADFFARLAWLERPPADFRAQVHDALADGRCDVSALRRLAGCGLSEPQLNQLGRAFARARAAGAATAPLTPFRLAVLSNATTEHLHAVLTGTALRYGIALDVRGFSYHEAYAVAVTGDVRLADYAPDLVLLAFDYRGLPLREAPGSEAGEQEAVEACRTYLQAMGDGVRAATGAPLMVQTVALPAGAGFGHADRRIPGSRVRIADELNRWIAGYADAVLDAAALAATAGNAAWFDAKLYHSAKMPFALHWLPWYADHVCRVIGALRGKSRRVLVLDLDNTLWGGVVGDDGVHGLAIGNGTAAGEAHLDLQRKALALRNRGVLLAVASKNDDEQARKPFREIPDMVLKEDAFAAFQANWDDKAANIRAIAQELSLGLDAFVFVDDNPHERALVRRFLPEVAVPELPDDPAGYALVLDAAGYFEAAAFSEEDARRADLYRSRSAIARIAPNDLEGYLATLDMRLDVDRIHDGNRARVVQLINKSNQFNLTTLRLGDADLRAMEAQPGFTGLALRLADTHDDHGLISVLLCETTGATLTVRAWLMSCRVIGRGVEKAVLRHLVALARAAGCTAIEGDYLPTERNGMVEQHYAKLGFARTGEIAGGGTRWTLALAGDLVLPETAIAVQVRDGDAVAA